ncbi:hypothetical protein PAMP_006696 [Pampus punctatissimus]
MEGSSKPETMTPRLGGTSATPGPLVSDPLEKLHSQADSYLTAARLVRRGWREERKKTAHPTLSSSDGNRGPNCAAICLKDPRSSWVLVTNSSKTAVDSETGSEKKTDEVKQASEGANRPSVNRWADRKKAGVLYVWTSGCRTTRFKAPILPVIAEI